MSGRQYGMKKLESVELVTEIPEAILEQSAERKTPDYDLLLHDAKENAVKLVMSDARSATNVYSTLKRRIRKDKLEVEIGKLGKEVYVFPPSMRQK
jgi:hypothetical protein